MEKDYNYFQFMTIPKEWGEALRSAPPRPEDVPITDNIVWNPRDEQVDVDGGYWEDGGFSVDRDDVSGTLGISSGRYDTVTISLEKVPLLLQAIALALEERDETPDR